MTSTMQLREWTTRERTGWTPGLADGEPDKRQWVDPATGLDCLMVRNRMGAWCGYVGVAEGHPWFGVRYSGCPQQCGEPWCSHSPDNRTRVHGGLTFSDFCDEPTREKWEELRTQYARHDITRDSAAFPEGDAACFRRYFQPFLNDYDGWAEAHQTRAICHIPATGRPARVWWFGFDCSHYDDRAPKGYGIRIYDDDGIYRDQQYVEAEVTSLAAQLAGAMATLLLASGEEVAE